MINRIEYGIRNAPPPFSKAKYGNLQTLPIPTESPTQEKINSHLEPQCSRPPSSSSVSVSPPLKWKTKKISLKKLVDSLIQDSWKHVMSKQTSRPTNENQNHQSLFHHHWKWKTKKISLKKFGRLIDSGFVKTCDEQADFKTD